MKFKIPDVSTSQYYQHSTKLKYIEQLTQLNGWMWACRLGHVLILLLAIVAANVVQYPDLERPDHGWQVGFVMGGIMMIFGSMIGGIAGVTAGFYSNIHTLDAATCRVGLRLVFANTIMLCSWLLTGFLITGQKWSLVMMWICLGSLSVVCAFGLHFYFKAHGKNKDTPSWSTMLRKL